MSKSAPAAGRTFPYRKGFHFRLSALIEQTLSEAMSQLEVEDSTAEDLKKKELALKRLVTKAISSR